MASELSISYLFILGLPNIYFVVCQAITYKWPYVVLTTIKQIEMHSENLGPAL